MRWAMPIASSIKASWNAWLSGIAGHPTADLEVVHRTLRVRDQRPARAISGSRIQGRSHCALPTLQAAVPVTATPRPTPPSARGLKRRRKSRRLPPQVVAQPASSEPAPKGDPVKERVLALVAEKTGYPVDMLDLDLDLEADLGVDTVKQAEMFAAIREATALLATTKSSCAISDTGSRDSLRARAEARDSVRKLRSPIVAAARPAGQPSEEHKAQGGPAASADSPTAVTAIPSRERILELMVEKTGYPQDMLDLDLDLEADLGVDTVKQAEMFAAIREIYNIPRDENRKLRDYPTLAHVIRFVYEKRPDLAGSHSATLSSIRPPAPSTEQHHHSAKPSQAVG